MITQPLEGGGEGGGESVSVDQQQIICGISFYEDTWIVRLDTEWQHDSI